VLGSECCGAEGDDRREAYTAIAWGGLLSLEKPKSVEAEAVTVAEGKMCGAAMRGVDALPWSKTPSRAKGSRRNLGDLVWSAVAEAIPDRDSKPKAQSVGEQARSRTRS